LYTFENQKKIKCAILSPFTIKPEHQNTDVGLAICCDDINLNISLYESPTITVGLFFCQQNKQNTIKNIN
jgi:hypothetical protein